MIENKNKEEWIIKGYGLVAEIGFDSINIEQISRLMNKNKSSFYHYFGEFPLYIRQLLSWHILRSQEFAQKMEGCESVNPGILNLAIEYKTDIFFHKQLRLKRSRVDFTETLTQAFSNYEKAVIDHWAHFFGLEQNPKFVSTFIHFFTENLLLKITFETFTFEWLERYANELKVMIEQMEKS